MNNYTVNHEYANYLAVKVKQGDGDSFIELLEVEELNAYLKTHVNNFYQANKDKIIEGYEDLCSILKFVTWEACKDFDPSKGNFLSRVCYLWKRHLARLYNHNTRKVRYISANKIAPLDDSIEAGDYTEAVLNDVIIKQIHSLDLTEKQKAAIGGVIRKRKRNQIADEYPRLFHSYRDVTKALREIKVSIGNI